MLRKWKAWLSLSLLACSDSNSSECASHIGIAADVMEECSGVWSQRNLSLETKFWLYSTCIIPVLLYSSETWTFWHTRTERVKLQAFHMRDQHDLLNKDVLVSLVTTRLPTVGPASAALSIAWLRAFTGLFTQELAETTYCRHWQHCCWCISTGCRSSNVESSRNGCAQWWWWINHQSGVESVT